MEIRCFGRLAAAWIVCSAPAWAQCETKLVAPDPVDEAGLGEACAVDGAVLVVGTKEEEAAHVFRRGAAGWVHEQVLRVAGTGAIAFGRAVAVSGDAILVGATDAGMAGAAFVFRFDGSGWSLEERLTPSDGMIGGIFGRAVAIVGDTAVVGNNGHHSPSGQAYVFERMGGAWTEAARLLPADGTGSDNFGYALDLSEDRGTVVVSALQPFIDTGAVYVFERQDGSWPQTAKLVPGDVLIADEVGESVSIQGDGLLVGSPWGSNGPEGAAYVFRRQGTGWIEEAKLRITDGSPVHRLGAFVALDGDLALLGTTDNDHQAVLFERVGSSWAQRLVLSPSDDPDGDGFGRGVDMDADTVVCGAARDPHPGPHAGAAYVYARSCLFAFQPYCRCDSGAPCGNLDAGAGCANSSGQGALLRTTPASSNGVAADDLVLTVSNVTPDHFGLLYMGTGQECTPFGDGLRAVHPGPPGFDYHRFPARNAGPAGVLTEGPGLVAQSTAFGPEGTITAGSTWNFQGFYRDPSGPCGSGFNLSNALSVSFTP